MDDIARELGKSKKTIYVHFPNKKALVQRTLIHHLKQKEKDVTTIRQHTENAIDEWYKVFEYNCRMISEYHASVIFDLQKYYPSSWKIFERHKHEFIYSAVYENILRGMKEGLYREDLNANIVARFYIYKIEIVADRSLFPESKDDPTTVLNEFTSYHMHGIVSKKGLLYIDKYQNLNYANPI